MVQRYRVQDEYTNNKGNIMRDIFRGRNTLEYLRAAHESLLIKTLGEAEYNEIKALTRKIDFAAKCAIERNQNKINNTVRDLTIHALSCLIKDLETL